MKTRVFIVAAALALGAPTAAHAAIIPVQELKGAFAASNSTVTKTPDGVHFGTYADATALGGTLTYNGINGTPVSALAEFGYTFTYRQAGNTTGAAPYARVFIDADPAVDSDLDGVSNNDIDHDIILDPSMVGATPAPGGTCPAVAPAQATDLTFTMSTSLVRFDDDQGADCVNSVMTFEDAKAAAGPNAVVSSLNVTQGFSTGQDVSALLRDMTVNANTFAFDVPPAPGVASTTTSTTTIPGARSGRGPPDRKRRRRRAGDPDVPRRHRASHPRAEPPGRAVPARQRRAPDAGRAARAALAGPHDHGRPAQPRRGELQRPPHRALPHEERQGPARRHAPQPQRRLLVGGSRTVPGAVVGPGHRGVLARLSRM
jgi:hypothetical protein